MPVRRHPSGHASVTGSSIGLLRLITLEKMLKLEIAGMKRSRPPSAYAIIKKEFELKGSRENVHEQLKELIKTVKAAQQGQTH